MAYAFSFTLPIAVEPELRALLGVDALDLSDDVIQSSAISGAAELELLKHLPTVDSILDDPGVTNQTKTRVGLALINFMAYYAYPGLRVRVLQSESDNKTIGARFKDAMNRDRDEFLNDAIKYIDQVVTPDSTDGSVKQLEFVPPAANVITGV